jgi:hypothetical protein
MEAKEILQQAYMKTGGFSVFRWCKDAWRKSSKEYKEKLFYNQWLDIEEIDKPEQVQW